MPLTVYYEEDADPKTLAKRSIAVLGYGSQGRAHALNLRDTGYQVRVVQRRGGVSYDRALQDGFQPIGMTEAVQQADLLIFALPDEAMGNIFQDEILPHLRSGQALGFIHGFAIRFETIVPPPEVDVIMIAPKGPGTLVRERFLQGGGITCIVAVHQDATGQAKPIALSWGRAIGGGRGGMIESTFAQECEADLFGEQTVLCGGVMELMKAAYELLVESGCPEELAYFECLHELKQVVDLQYAAGMTGMRRAISSTACYGGLTRGRRLIDKGVRQKLRQMLDEIQSGRFAKEWIQEACNGKPQLKRLMDEEAGHGSESAGQRVRLLAQRALPIGANLTGRSG